MIHDYTPKNQICWFSFVNMSQFNFYLLKRFIRSVKSWVFLVFRCRYNQRYSASYCLSNFQQNKCLWLIIFKPYVSDNIIHQYFKEASGSHIPEWNSSPVRSLANLQAARAGARRWGIPFAIVSVRGKCAWRPVPYISLPNVGLRYREFVSWSHPIMTIQENKRGAE